MEEDVAMLGITLKLPDTLTEPEDSYFSVLPENWPVLEAFWVLDGCAWQYTGMGDLIGLDYTAADLIWRGCGMVLDTEVFRGVMLFSKTVVLELAKHKKTL